MSFQLTQNFLSVFLWQNIQDKFKKRRGEINGTHECQESLHLNVVRDLRKRILNSFTKSFSDSEYIEVLFFDILEYYTPPKKPLSLLDIFTRRTEDHPTLSSQINHFFAGIPQVQRGIENNLFKSSTNVKTKNVFYSFFVIVMSCRNENIIWGSI